MNNKLMDKLNHFRLISDLDLFDEIFGLWGEHLYGKFLHTNNDVIAFYFMLDLSNQKKFRTYIIDLKEY